VITELSASFAEVTAWSVIFIVVIALSPIFGAVTELSASLAVVTAASLIFAVTTELSASLVVVTAASLILTVVIALSAILAVVIFCTSIVGLGYVPVRSPPAGPDAAALPAYKAYGTDTSCAVPILMNAVPPSGSISTCMNLAPLFQLIPPTV